MNLIYRNLNLNNLNDKAKIPIKNYNSDNNISDKAFTTPIIDEQKYNSNLKKLKLNKFISNNSSCYILKNQLKIMETKLTKNISDNAGLKKNF